jgi:hypothetical protein
MDLPVIGADLALMSSVAYSDPDGSGEPLYRPLPKAQLSQLIRKHKHALVQEEPGLAPAGVSIYTLSDPRDVREVRYVGQTRAPLSRFSQHVNAARLWLPDEKPWWYKAPPGLRPLHDWIRALHRDDYRLPAMIITARVASVSAARHMERALILHYLGKSASLLNVEAEILGRQVPLGI